MIPYSVEVERIEIEHDLIAVRYNVADYIVEILGNDWRHEIVEAMTQLGRATVRDLSHETCVDLGEDAPSKFELTTISGVDLTKRLPKMTRLYREFGALFEDQVDPENMNYYLDPNDSYEAYMQLPEIDNEDSSLSRSLEPHTDGRYSGILVVEAPVGEGGELTVLNEDLTELAKIRHQSGTFVVFPEGRRLPHYTEPMKSTDDSRLVISMNYPDVEETQEQRDKLYEFVHNS